MLVGSIYSKYAIEMLVGAGAGAMCTGRCGGTGDGKFWSENTPSI